jgi:hypothetical protein
VPQALSERISERSGVSRSADSASSLGVSANTALGEYRAIFERGILAGNGSGGNDVFAE